MSSEQKQKIINLLTICIKAGKTIKGFDSVCDTLKEGLASCVMTASDASEKTVKETAFMCDKYNVDLLKTDLSKEEISGFVGKQTAVIAICDKGFAEQFKKLSR